MTSKKSLPLMMTVTALLLAGCNLYSPLDSGGTDADRIELAQKCLTNSDYECAITEYKALTDASLRREKLCLVYIGQAGFGLSQLIKISQSVGNKQKVLGTVANAMLPYTAAKKAAADSGITACQDYRTNASAGTDEAKLALLLNTLVKFTRCGVLLGRTTKELATSDADTTCNTPSTNATVTAASISPAGNGSVSIGQPGMCAADAIQCAGDIEAIAADSAALTAAGLGNVKDSLSNVPAGASHAGGGPQVIRLGLIQTF